MEFNKEKDEERSFSISSIEEESDISLELQ